MLNSIKLLLLHLIFLGLSSSLFAAELPDQKKVVFLSPSDQTSPFFSQTTTIMLAAAANLNLDLEVIHSEDLVIVSRQVEAVFNRANLPDYIVLTSLRGVTEQLMRKADGLGIHTLLFNAGLPPQAIHDFRYGEDPLKNWIGQILPDDQQAGRLTAKKLVEAARSTGQFDESQTIQMIGINGSIRSPASIQREIGLREYVSEQPDVHLHQVVYTDWNTEEARNKASLLLKRYSDVSVIWTAADVVALGSTQAAKLNDLVPGEDIFIAGVDWLTEIHTSILNYDIAGSVGGHSFDGAWALVVVYDHINGAIDKFVDERTYFHWVDKKSLHKAKKLMDEQVWQSLDFRQYSKTQSQGVNYNFSVDRLLENPLLTLE